MPTGSFVRWLPDTRCKNRFYRKKSEKHTMSYDWLDWESHRKGISSMHRLNSGREKRIGPFLVDGYDLLSRTCYEFLGCYFHGHSCVVQNEKAKLRFNRTVERTRYLRGLGYEVICMWECDFRKTCETDVELQDYLKTRQYPFTSAHANTAVSQETLLNAVITGSLYGLVEVDIHVPDELYEHFCEMAPIFATCKVPLAEMGNHMRDFVREKKPSKRDRTLLVGGIKASRILLATPLLRWYLQHGLVVTKIYQAVEYKGMKCFKPFVEKVTVSRCLGDSDKDLAIMGEVWKLIGNSAYGSLLMDKTRHTTCKYVHGENSVLAQVNKRHFLSLCALDDDDFEVISLKRSISVDMPSVLGYFVLQYAKLRMLQFHYEFLLKFLDKSAFELLQCDTDSCYFALSEKTLRLAIKPEKLTEYDRMLYGFCDKDDIEADDKMHFLPRECCAKHAMRDKRTPGLFKVESEGDEMVSLNSKTYALRQSDNSVKLSCKGLNKRKVHNPMNLYRSVLRDGMSRSIVNTGFRSRNNTMYTYQQRRSGLSYFYAKRAVMSDGVTTRPLRLTLKPVSR